MVAVGKRPYGRTNPPDLSIIVLWGLMGISFFVFLIVMFSLYPDNTKQREATEKYCQTLNSKPPANFTAEEYSRCWSYFDFPRQQPAPFIAPFGVFGLVK
jgi:hypothetical protein